MGDLSGEQLRHLLMGGGGSQSWVITRERRAGRMFKEKGEVMKETAEVPLLRSVAAKVLCSDSDGAATVKTE